MLYSVLLFPLTHSLRRSKAGWKPHCDDRFRVAQLHLHCYINTSAAVFISGSENWEHTDLLPTKLATSITQVHIRHWKDTQRPRTSSKDDTLCFCERESQFICLDIFVPKLCISTLTLFCLYLLWTAVHWN